jgi:transposase-like protein
MVSMKAPRTLQEAITYFSDPDRAFDYAVKLRWPNGDISCPRCEARKFSFIKTRRIWFCYACKRQFTVKVKTIMEDSALGLDKWMTAVWMAWFMLHRVREALKKHSFDTSKIGGEGSTLEVDETSVGGIAKNMHRGQRVRAEGKGPYKNKTIVQGILDRTLRQVRAQVVPNVTRETLQDEILKNVKYGSTVYTDNAVAYDNGMQRRFVHDVVNKTETYVRGQVHVNGMENFWALLKRGLKGTYVAVEPFHLSRYVDEQVFRYNHRKDGDRKLNDADRFAAAMAQVAGRRLTYSELTGKSDSPHHPATGTGTEEPF